MALASRAFTVYPEIFARILFSIIELKDIFVTLKFATIGHDLRILVNDSVISAFCEDFIVTQLSRK